MSSPNTRSPRSSHEHSPAGARPGRELDDAIGWHVDQAPGLGDAFLLEILKVLKLIKQFPQAWHPLTLEIRRCRLKRFPYSVVYTLDAADILDLAVAHQHRKPSYWRNRSEVR